MENIKNHKLSFTKCKKNDIFLKRLRSHLWFFPPTSSDSLQNPPIPSEMSRNSEKSLKKV